MALSLEGAYWAWFEKSIIQGIDTCHTKTICAPTTARRG